MFGYFKPLRRKIGVLTLLLACVFAAGWVRSYSTADIIAVPTRVNLQYRLYSLNGMLIWERIHSRWAGNKIEGFFQHRQQALGRSIYVDDLDSCYQFDGNSHGTTGFYAGESLYGRMRNDDIGLKRTFWIVPYWSIVIPLTLLSAWLLLSKPRRPRASTPEQITPS